MDGRSTPRRTEDTPRPIDPSPHRRKDYEPPRVVVMGPLSKMTLGSGGSKSDGINKLKH